MWVTGDNPIDAGLNGAGDLKVVLEVGAGQRLGCDQGRAIRGGEIKSAKAVNHRSLSRLEIDLLPDNVKDGGHRECGSKCPDLSATRCIPDDYAHSSQREHVAAERPEAH